MNSKFLARRIHTKGSPSSSALVVWGQNLPSGVGLGRIPRKISDLITLPPFQKSVIVGLILSDG